MAQGLATTRMSERGKVLIPRSVRTDMGLKDGDEFVVIKQGDAVVLKVITAPSPDEYPGLVRRLRRHARDAGLSRRDVAVAVRKVRSRR